MKKFRANHYPKIEELEVVKETPKQVTYLTIRGNEIRESKESQWHKWFDTKEEAREFLKTTLNRKIEVEKIRIQNYERELLIVDKL